MNAKVPILRVTVTHGPTGCDDISLTTPVARPNLDGQPSGEMVCFRASVPFGTAEAFMKETLGPKLGLDSFDYVEFQAGGSSVRRKVQIPRKRTRKAATK